MTTMTEDQRAALAAAATLARLGVPLFCCRPDPDGTGHSGTGFWFPSGWQHTQPDPTVVDRWEPGMALCAVMGVALDLLDVDPRNGGDLSALEATPRAYGVAATPSDGVHAFIAPLHAGSHDNVYPGVDVKGGFADGTSRGFAFLAPTERPSKVTGALAAYRWVREPEPWVDPDDVTGEALAARVRAVRSEAGAHRAVGGPDWWQAFMASSEPQSAAAATRAIETKLGEITAWDIHAGTGFRDVLMRASLTLGGYVGGGWLDEPEAIERLEAACAEVWGEPDDDDQRWITQGLADGSQRPFHVYTPDDELRYGAQDGPAAFGQGEGPATQRWTVYTGIGTEPYDPAGCAHDQEHAEAVLARCAPVLRYATDAGTWVRRAETDAWTETAADQAGAAVVDVARLMPLGATPVPRDAADRTPEHWQAVRRATYLSSPGSGKIKNKIRDTVAGGSHPSSLRIADLDTEPELIWAGGTAWDLRASTETPTPAGLDPTTPHLHTAAVTPARVPTPAWDHFTATLWPDLEVRAWALRVLSVALTGYPDAALPVLYGPERTGKTSLVQLLVRLLGTYGHSADARLLGSGADNTHASVVYALKGRRLSFIDEGPRRGHLAIERLKQLTGGGALTGNAMRANPITFTPTHTLVMTTNDEPPITDPALRARIRLLPCEADQHEVRRARQAITDAVWADEAPGVLAALMAEAGRWLAEPDSAGNPAAPAVVRDTVGEMAVGQSPVAEWVQQCTVPADPGTPARTLHRRFVTWMEGQPVYRRQAAPTETAFGRTLTELGFPRQRPDGVTWTRPLSVMGMGPDGLGAPEPMGTGHMPLRQVPAGFSPGSGGQPGGSENPSSTPVLKDVSPGSPGISATSPQNTHTTTANGGPQNTQPTGNADSGGGPGGGDAANVGSPATTGLSPGSAEPGGEPGGGHDSVTDESRTSADQGKCTGTPDSASGKTGADLRKHASEDPQRADGPDSGGSSTDSDETERQRRNRETREAAALADQDKITKAEARARLKADKIAAAVAEAGGEHLPLPAVVDRDGHTLAVTSDQARSVLEAALERSGALTVDVETSGYPIGHASFVLRSVQLGDHIAAVVLDPDETGQRRLAAEFLAVAPRLHAHSATADLVPLAMAGLIDHDEAWTRMHDTVLTAKLADPASTGSDPGLKKLAAAVLGETAAAPAADAAREALFKAGRWLTNIKTDTPPERSGWAQVPTGSTTMLRYAASDVLDTAALTRTLPAPDPSVLERERRFQAMTARVAHHGVALDAERVTRLSAEHTEAADGLGGRIRSEYGIDNPGSTAQIGEALLTRGAHLPLTPTGKPSVTAAVLEKLRHTEGPVGELSATVLDYRHHQTLNGLFLGPYAELCARGDGRARPTIYTLSADTGRTSATRPNIQQLPKTGGIRACLTADPGHVIVSADFSSVELRVAAALSQDPTLLAFLNEGRDLHAEVAAQVWGESAGKAERYIAKRIVFGRLYGGGLSTLAAQAGVTEGVAASAVEALDALTPGLSAWSATMRDAARAGHTRFPTRSGRIVHLQREYPHKAGNFGIQGEARELLVDAYLRLSDTRWGECVNFPVHDEIDLFVPEGEADEATAALVECMETELYGVKISAEASAPSYAWADAT